MFAIDIVVALHHLQHALPPVGQIFQLMSLHSGLVGILQVDPMVELNIEVDLTLPQIANTEGNHCAIASKGRVVLILRIFSSRIFMNGFVFDHMEVILRCFPLDGDLVTTVLLHTFVEALDLVQRQKVVKANGLRQLKQNQKDQQQGVQHELIIKIVEVQSYCKLSGWPIKLRRDIDEVEERLSSWRLILTGIKIDNLQFPQLFHHLQSPLISSPEVCPPPIQANPTTFSHETSRSQYKSSIRKSNE